MKQNKTLQFRWLYSLGATYYVGVGLTQLRAIGIKREISNFQANLAIDG